MVSATGVKIYETHNPGAVSKISVFTLDGKDRKYQPYNNVCVSSDDVIMERIHEFKFFKALFKFTLQGRRVL